MKKTATVLKKKQKLSAIKKRLNLHDQVIQKLMELLDGIKIHPVKGVVLSPEKKLQLAAYQKIEQKLFKSCFTKSKNPRA